MTAPVTPTILREWLTHELASNELRDIVADLLRGHEVRNGWYSADAVLAAITRHLEDTA